MRKKIGLGICVFGMLSLMGLAVVRYQSPENTAFRKCNTNADRYLPYPLQFGMSREEAREKIKQLFPNVDITWAEKDVDTISIPSTKYDMAWFGFKKDRLVTMWYSRHKDPLISATSPDALYIEQYIHKWYSEFESKSGYINSMRYNWWEGAPRKWFSSNGDSIVFVVDQGLKEQYYCLSALSLK